MLDLEMTSPHVTEMRPALEPVEADPFVSDLARAARPLVAPGAVTEQADDAQPSRDRPGQPDA